MLARRYSTRTRNRPRNPPNPCKARMKKTPLRKVSKKREGELRVYRVLKAEFLKRRPNCEIFEPCCTRKSVDVHHVNGRNGKRLLIVSDWLSCCRACHSIIHSRPQYAREMGFLK